MKKIILILTTAAFCFSPMLVTQAEAKSGHSHGSHHAKHHSKHHKHHKHHHKQP